MVLWIQRLLAWIVWKTFRWTTPPGPPTFQEFWAGWLERQANL